MQDNYIYRKVAEHVTGLFEEFQNENLVYHDLEHTQNVVNHVQEIAGHYQLTEKEMMTLYIAAWFHDTGHLIADIAEHEKKSVELMKDFMQHETIDEELINGIEACILATRMPHEPKNLLEEIICDADTYHFGTKDFKKTNKKIKEEYQRRNYNTITFDWPRNTLELLERHKYFTTYCQELLQEGKQKNMERVRKKMLKEEHSNIHNLFNEEIENNKKAKEKNSMVIRGIQTMLRVTTENHMELSSMADGKANILISVNAIIISVILTVLVRKLEVEPHLTIPTILFLAFSVATIITAILATLPKVTEGRFSKDDIIRKRTNLLFFGNFHKSDFKDYEWAMSTMMKDKDYLYSSMLQDIHQLGIVLGRKYRLIRTAYHIFMVGIIVSVIAFGLAVMLNDPAANTPTVITPDAPPI